MPDLARQTVLNFFEDNIITIRLILCIKYAQKAKLEFYSDTIVFKLVM